MCAQRTLDFDRDSCGPFTRHLTRPKAALDQRSHPLSVNDPLKLRGPNEFERSDKPETHSCTGTLVIIIILNKNMFFLFYVNERNAMRCGSFEGKKGKSCSADKKLLGFVCTTFEC